MKKENLKNHLRDLSFDSRNSMTKFTMTENKVIDTNKYIEFVRQTTSPASSDFASLLARLTELEVTSDDADVPRLMTAAFGISAEAGEFTEVIKKIFLARQIL
jgi:hypothetical protein